VFRRRIQWSLEIYPNVGYIISHNLRAIGAMREIPLYEAKNGLSALVSEVETTGETVVITRHGKPVARLSAIVKEDRAEARSAVARLLIEQLDRSPSVEGPTWEELKSEMDAERP